MEMEGNAVDKKGTNKLRDLFIRRMTVDSETKDRRRKDFNQAIFHVESDEDIDAWNAECEKYGMQKKKIWSKLSCLVGNIS